MDRDATTQLCNVSGISDLLHPYMKEVSLVKFDQLLLVLSSVHLSPASSKINKQIKKPK